MESQLRTLVLQDGRRTTLRFDMPTWAAVDTVAALSELKWTEWARRAIDGNSATENMHAVIRAAAVASLLAHSLITERADAVNETAGHSVLFEAVATFTDKQLADELIHAQVDGAPIDMLGFKVHAGFDRNNQPTIWIENGLRDCMHIAIAIPFSAIEVESKRGAFR